ncbi:MAG: hypothetical protein ACNA7W_14905, partial [Pseudomonadales bacterium]
YLFRVLNWALAEPEVRQALVPVPRGPQVVALLLAIVSILLGLLSAMPYDLLQQGRAPVAAEGLS